MPEDYYPCPVRVILPNFLGKNNTPVEVLLENWVSAFVITQRYLHIQYRLHILSITSEEAISTHHPPPLSAQDT